MAGMTGLEDGVFHEAQSGFLCLLGSEAGLRQDFHIPALKQGLNFNDFSDVVTGENDGFGHGGWVSIQGLGRHNFR
jgi:hypothetical protein